MTCRLRLRAALFVAIIGLAAGTLTMPAIAQPVDVRLVLAVDSSSSVDMDEFYLQLEGYAAAFSHPNLLAAIQSGPNRAIAVTLIEWSGEGEQTINFPWRRLDSAASLSQFARELAVAPRLIVGGETAIGEAIEFAQRQFAEAGFAGGRQVIDISGDGMSNRGRSVEAARNHAINAGITVNGLAILNEVPELEAYYRDLVIGGRGAFVLAARDYADFAEAILDKLLREVTTIAAVRLSITAHKIAPSISQEVNITD